MTRDVFDRHLYQKDGSSHSPTNNFMLSTHSTLSYSCLYVSCRYLVCSSVKHGSIILLLSSAIADVLTSVPLPLLLSLSHAWISMISTITPMSLSNCWPLRGSKQLLCCCECSTYVFSQCRRHPSSLRGRVYIHITRVAVWKKFQELWCSSDPQCSLAGII